MEKVLWYGGHDIYLKDILKSEGIYVYGENGNRYADLESGVWALPLGHNHPVVVDAIKKQAEKCIHTGYCYSSIETETACDALLKTVGFEDGQAVLLTSGSEAVELGVQIIRHLTGKKYLLTMSDSFLGSFGSAAELGDDEWYLFDWFAAVIDLNVNQTVAAVRCLRGYRLTISEGSFSNPEVQVVWYGFLLMF